MFGKVEIDCGIVVFFFKQKTAYEMRISDWSSDVCSSDLSLPRRAADGRHTDFTVLPCAISYGRNRRAQVRHGRHRIQEGRHRLEPDSALLVSLPVADIHRWLHDVGLFARAIGILGHSGFFPDQLPDRKSTRLASSH